MKLNPSEDLDYNILEEGIYLYKINDDITTYDIRMKAPNKEQVLTNSAIHTLEHIINTYLKTVEFADNIIFFGPMGSRTGFYLLARNLSSENAIKLVRDSFKFISEFNGDIPGATEAECGNYLEHDLESAKKDVLPLLKKLENYTPEMLDYSWHSAEKL